MALTSHVLDLKLDFIFKRAWLQIVTEFFIRLNFISVSSLNIFNKFDFSLKRGFDTSPVLFEASQVDISVLQFLIPNSFQVVEPDLFDQVK